MQSTSIFHGSNSESKKEVANKQYKATKLVGDLILERQEKLLGHILRLDHSDLMRKVTCDENLRRPFQLYKRTGGPRSNWYEDNLNRVYQRTANVNVNFDHDNADHVNFVKEAAIHRLF